MSWKPVSRTVWVLLGASLACSGRTELGNVLVSKEIPCAGDRVVARDPLGAVGLAIDETGAVFWGTRSNELWTDRGGVATRLAVERAGIDAIATDATTLFFASGDTIYSGPIPNGPFSAFARGGAFDAVDIVVDETALYFIHQAPLTNSGALYRVDRATRTTTLLFGLRDPSTLTADPEAVYFSADEVTEGTTLVFQGPAIFRVPKGSGKAQLIAEGHLATALANDATRLFFLEWRHDDHGGVRSVSKNGGVVTSLADTGRDELVSITIDAENAYVATDVGSSVLRGVIRRIALDGSSNTVWAHTDGDAFFTNIRSDQTTVAWTSWPTTEQAGLPSVQKKCK